MYDESCVLENTWLKVAGFVESKNDCVVMATKTGNMKTADKLHPVVVATRVVK